jgi:putative hydrolase of the HAD superfamily
MRPARTLVFDLDDTLFPERTYVRSGFAAVGRHVQEQFGRADFENVAWGLFLDDVRGRIFDATLSRLGIASSPRLIGTLVQIYREHRPRIVLFPDVEPVIQTLRPHACVAIVSDGPLISQERKVEALGLHRLFGPIVLTDRWGRAFWKPHERAFREIEAATGCRGSECVYVADNPAKDFVAPRRLGWWTARVRRPGGEHAAIAAAGAAHIECRDLEEVAAWLREGCPTIQATGEAEAGHSAR